ncbi:hypothetical protein AB0420_03465 [Streptomyces caelestis]|uniref:Uncharacterized protein n=1 Tax=Streptomyces heliomycini TaxID=284032 RepID=A0ABV5LAV6_9ACTN|nr:hypothetical protein [Streptomyces sp. XY152]
MGDGVQWMVGAVTSSGWMLDVHFARGIDAEELAVRMGARREAAAGPMTDAETEDLDVDGYPGRGPGSAVVRVGEHAGWAFAVLYGRYHDRLGEVSRDGVEAVHYHHNSEHPPTTVLYARDGRTVCGYGLGEERVRWGEERDRFLPDLVAAGILNPDGDTYRETGDYDRVERKRLGLAVFEERLGLSLPRTVLTEDRLPVYAVMGSPADDFEEISSWAGADGRPLPDRRLGLIPAGLRRDYERATAPRWRERGAHHRVAVPTLRAEAVLKAPGPGTEH